MLRVGAGNYGGKLGKFHYQLGELARMSALVLTLREQPPQRCDLSQLHARQARRGDAGAIERIEIQTTRRPLLRRRHLRRDAGRSSTTSVLEGGSERFDYLGAGMKAGQHPRDRRSRPAGRPRHERRRDRWSTGASGRLAGSGMSGGRIEIGGDAGDLVGAPLPGEASGMTGGVIRIRGSAGARAGDRMRRGLIAIEGDAGDNLASRMFGGTIVCFGRAGALPGYLMRRGTVMIGGGAASLSPTFIDTGVHELVALRLIARWLIARRHRRRLARSRHGCGASSATRRCSAKARSSCRSDGECDEPGEPTAANALFVAEPYIIEARECSAAAGAQRAAAARTRRESKCRPSP